MVDLTLIDEFEPFMNHDTKTYDGQMERRKNNKVYCDNPMFKRSIAAYSNIKRRIKSDSSYKGLSFEISRRELTYWFIVQHRFFKLKSPSVGRIDHSKGYTIDNIKLEELSDNTKEMCERVGPRGPMKPRKVNIFSKKGDLIAVARSSIQASYCTGTNQGCVSAVCRGVKKAAKGWRFEYANP